MSFKFACQYIANQMAVMAGALSPAHTTEVGELVGPHKTFDRKRPSYWKKTPRYGED